MGKILIVEDDKKISRILKLQLERKNHEITIIENGIDALNEIDRKRDFYDLILLDLGLPSMEGNEVCKNVRKISKVPIIVVSAKNNIRINNNSKYPSPNLVIKRKNFSTFSEL